MESEMPLGEYGLELLVTTPTTAKDNTNNGIQDFFFAAYAFTPLIYRKEVFV
ncbi:hypothetical protein [Mucilaginibacter oryzae]|uniref:hypothetical protein n=1 Tax=Mucilaginibacter oryzae TaxID=468058 RepID=UPI00147434F6|nr:hypothetical protein [Mucilaginibacter oryzae]